MESQPAKIYKIVPKVLWDSAQDAGIFNGAPIDLQDGFIHFSTASQVKETAAKHFAGQSDLLLLTIDAPALGEALKYEVSRGGALFPHLYAAMPLSTVLIVDELPLDENGNHIFPETLS